MREWMMIVFFCTVLSGFNIKILLAYPLKKNEFGKYSAFLLFDVTWVNLYLKTFFCLFLLEPTDNIYHLAFSFRNNFI